MTEEYQYSAKDYMTAIRRRRRALFYVSAPIFLVAFCIALVLPNQYSSSAKIDIDVERKSLQALEPIELTHFAEQYIAKLKERVLSRTVLTPLGQKIRPISENFRSMSEADLLENVKDSININLLTQPVILQSAGREVQVISGFEVTASTGDPRTAFTIADFVADEFLKADKVTRTEKASSTTTFLRDQVKDTEQEIATLEQKIANFKVENQCCLPELRELNLSVIQRAERDIEGIEPRINTLQQEKLFYESQLEEIRQQSGSSDRLADLEKEYSRLVANYGENHPDVARVRREIAAITESSSSASDDSQQLADLRAKLEEAEQKYSPEHPDVIRYKREIANLEAQEKATNASENRLRVDNPRYIQLRTQLNSVEAELVELRTRAPELRKKIDEYEARLRKTPQIESAFQALTRDLDTAQQNFENLQKRLDIARQTEALESTDFGARLTEARSPETPQEPSGPPRIVILIIGIFLATTVGIGTVVIAEATDSSVRSSSDVESMLDLVPLAAIPLIVNQQGHAAHRRHNMLLASVSVLVLGVAIVYFFTRVI